MLISKNVDEKISDIDEKISNIDKGNNIIDKEKYIAQLKINPSYITSLDEQSRNDKEIVRYALEQNGLLLQYTGEVLKNDKQIVMIAMSQNPMAFMYISDILRTDQNFVVECLNKYWECLLPYIPEYVKRLDGVQSVKSNFEMCKLIKSEIIDLDKNINAIVNLLWGYSARTNDSLRYLSEYQPLFAIYDSSGNILYWEKRDLILQKFYYQRSSQDAKYWSLSELQDRVKTENEKINRGNQDILTCESQIKNRLTKRNDLVRRFLAAGGNSLPELTGEMVIKLQKWHTYFVDIGSLTAVPPGGHSTEPVYKADVVDQKWTPAVLESNLNLSPDEKAIKDLDDLFAKITKMENEYDNIYWEAEKLNKDKMKMFFSTDYRLDVLAKWKKTEKIHDDIILLVKPRFQVRNRSYPPKEIVYKILDIREARVDQMKKNNPSWTPKWLNQN